jgi:proteasome lid subunit RPN8/RPN11
MDPADVSSALTGMKREKTRHGAIVHSHPNAPPSPSWTDLVETKAPGIPAVCSNATEGARFEFLKRAVHNQG